MIRYLRQQQVDKQKWDNCVAASNEGVMCMLSWYLDIVSPGWHALVDEEGSIYASVLPLTGTNKLGFSRLGSPHFCQQLGLASVNPETNITLLGQFLKEVTKRYRFIHNYKFLTENSAALEHLTATFHLKPRHTRYLALDKPYPEIYKGYNHDRKMNLKRARRAGLVMTESGDIEPMLDFFKKHVAHKVVGGVEEPTYQMLRDLFSNMLSRGLCRLLYTSKDGKLNAGCLFAKYKNKISYTFNAADEVGRVANGRTLMLDEMIRQHAASAYTLDFESPAIEQIDAFYASFGSEKAQYYALNYNNLPLPIRLIRDLRIYAYRTLSPNKGIAEEA
ncbi:GNAT family N-acetyltransferase [Pontibacter sp. E15-1]|uniref:GNAT family N-acetyltransferase n=1 Tax=Pontibacter sp. E15-1 TaxID=2919918 RepID=UPI001F4F73CB|nr:GNAT family N-acetyltransferase [Pontibacter sp. E15-1]MCJ8164007.1 GNAT family N-acetyltransferase [Pontibacter sp. E15-1]